MKEKEQKKELERRDFLCEVRAEQTERGRVLTGRPIVYNSRTDLGLFDEVIESGALDRADLRDVRFLVNHDTSKIPLARSRRNNASSTMQLSIDAEGLAIRVDLDTDNNADARALYSAVERGDITGMSFMFAVRAQEWEGLDTEHPLRRITDISTVVEVSAVTFPAYDAAGIYARSEEALESARAELDSARQQRAESLDSDMASLELAKAKYTFKSKF